MGGLGVLFSFLGTAIDNGVGKSMVGGLQEG